MLLFVVLLSFLSAAPTAESAGKAETSPADVLTLLTQAKEKAAAKDWAAAARIMERVVALNPVQPSGWERLGRYQYGAKEYREAALAYEKATDLGGTLQGTCYSIYNAACSWALAGDKERAIDALTRAYWLGFPDYQQMTMDEDLSSIRSDPRIAELLSLQDVSKMSRDEGWRYDLNLLAHEVHRKGFNPHLYVVRPVSVEVFDQKVEQLRQAIPTLSDGQIVLGMAKIMASLEDGHSAVWNFGENPLFRAALPLRMFWFEEGLFVTAADPSYKSLLGAQIVRFDDTPTESVFKTLDPYIGRDHGNPMHARTSLPYVVRTLSLMHAAGLIKQPDRVTLTVRDLSGKTKTVTVQADTKETNIWNTLPAPPSWVTFAGTLPSVPLYLRNMGTGQWFEYLPEQKTVYFQFNKVLNDEKEPLDQFSKRLFKFIDEHDVEKLVIDMRWNNGGNTVLGQPLLMDLLANQKVNQKGKLFVILGRRTYSAAQNMATYFERYTDAIFVGEPTGSSPNFVGEEDPITLPYSKVMANVSHLFWQSSWPQDQRIWLAPQIYVPPTFAGFRKGRDAALEAILAQSE